MKPCTTQSHPSGANRPQCHSKSARAPYSIGPAVDKAFRSSAPELAMNAALPSVNVMVLILIKCKRYSPAAKRETILVLDHNRIGLL